MTLYILQTFDGRYLNNEQHWTETLVAAELYCTRFHDEAINQLIELNAEDTALRARVIKCAADSRGCPVLSPSASSAANSDTSIDAA